MTIRFLNSDDAIDYSVLRKFSLYESPYAFSDSFEDEENKILLHYQNEIQKWGNPLEAFTLGAFNDLNLLVGFVKFKRDQRSKARHRASLHSLYVKPEYRGKGIAKMLVTELIKIVEPIPGIEQLQLSSIVSHISLIEFYENLGFQKLGGLIEKDLIINGKYVDAWYMVKHLKQ
ncbi:MAG: GNAT family N-acetyltransferase [Bacteroidia bacterium]|nr:GNAT family N-acetyltransferase [Bacteroidia bacterium]